MLEDGSCNVIFQNDWTKSEIEKTFGKPSEQTTNELIYYLSKPYQQVTNSLLKRLVFKKENNQWKGEVEEKLVVIKQH